MAIANTVSNIGGYPSVASASLALSALGATNFIVVGVSVRQTSGQAVTAVQLRDSTTAVLNLQLVGAGAPTGGSSVREEVWASYNATTGAALTIPGGISFPEIFVTFSAAAKVVIKVSCWSGVDTTLPLRVQNTVLTQYYVVIQSGGALGLSTTALHSSTSDVCVDSYSVQSQPTVTANAGQTQFLGSPVSSSGGAALSNLTAAFSQKPGAADGTGPTMGYTNSSSFPCILFLVSLQPSSGGTAFTKTVTRTASAGTMTIARVEQAKRTPTRAATAGTMTLARVETAKRTATRTSAALAPTVAGLKTARRPLTRTGPAITPAVARVGTFKRSASRTAIFGNSTVNRLLTLKRTLTRTATAGTMSAVAIKVIRRTLTRTSAALAPTVNRVKAAVRTLTRTSVALAPTLARSKKPARTPIRTATAGTMTLTQIRTSRRSLTRTTTAGVMAVVRSGSTYQRALARTFGALPIATLSRAGSTWRRAATRTASAGVMAVTRQFVQHKILTRTSAAVAPTLARSKQARRTNTRTSTSLTPTLSRAGTISRRALTRTSAAFAPVVARMKQARRTLTRTGTILAPSVVFTLTPHIFARALTRVGPTMTDTVARVMTARRTLTRTGPAAVRTLARLVTYRRTPTRTSVSFAPTVSRVEQAKRALTRTSASVAQTLSVIKTTGSNVFQTYGRQIRYDASKLTTATAYFEVMLATSDPVNPSHNCQAVLQRNTLLDGSGSWVNVITLASAASTPTLLRSSNIIASLPLADTLYRAQFGGQSAGGAVNYTCSGASIVVSL